MNITVFGGAGFLGSHVCDSLAEAGHQVLCADIVSSPWLHQGQRGMIADVTVPGDVAAAVHGADAVLNFAGIADIAEANADPAGTARVNIMGNVTLLEACRLAGVKRYIFASSLYVYGRSGGIYRAGKQSCELYIEAYHGLYNLPYTIVRYGSLYGPRSDNRNALHRFVHEILTMGRVVYCGAPDNRREYMHVRDAADMTVRLLAPDFAGKNILLTGSQPMLMSELFRMLGDMLGRQFAVEYNNGVRTDHYAVTPYSFSPGEGSRLMPAQSVDLGQGLLDLLKEVHQEIHSST